MGLTEHMVCVFAYPIIIIKEFLNSFIIKRLPFNLVVLSALLGFVWHLAELL